jgi:ribosome biogenesis protein UTP30
MARSKKPRNVETAVVKAAKDSEGALTKKDANGSQYQLDPAQVERAATALVKNMKEHAKTTEEKADKKNLVADEDEPEQDDTPVFLNLVTKQHVKDQHRLKPSKISVPHSTLSNDVRICLFTADPQRQYKDVVADDAFPEELRAKIGRVLGLEKLQKKYKTYESKRQLLAEYDVFLADDRVLNELPRFLGKVFNANKTKRPIPVDLAPQIPKDKDGKRKRVVRKPQDFGKEIEKALNSAYVHLSPSATTSIRVGKLSQTPKQLTENIEAVVTALADKFVPQGWKNIRAIHVKGPTTVALPIWLADELWSDDAQVLDQPRITASKDGAAKFNSEKKRKWNEWEEELLDDDELAEIRAKTKKNKAKELKAIEAPKETSSISKETRKKLKQDALKSVPTPIVAG